MTKNNNGTHRIVNSEKVPDLRQQGYSLKEIAQECGGVTEEAIRRHLKRYYPELLYPVNLLCTIKAAEKLGIGVSRFQKLAAMKGIKPAHSSCGWSLWSSASIKRISRLINKKCKNKSCGKDLPKGRFSFCSNACYLEAAKYKNLSRKKKAKHDAIVRRYRKRIKTGCV